MTLSAILLPIIDTHPTATRDTRDARLAKILDLLLGKSGLRGRKKLVGDDDLLLLMAREYHLDFFGFTARRRSDWELAKLAATTIPGFTKLNDSNQQSHVRRLTGKFKKRKDELVNRATEQHDPEVQAWQERVHRVAELLKQLGVIPPH